MQHTTSRSSRPSTHQRRKEPSCPPTTDTTSQTAHLLALMKKGDDAFNARDFAAVDAVHHPNMVAYIPGLAEPVYGREAHAAAMQQMLRMFPDMHVYSDPYPIQFGQTTKWDGDQLIVISAFLDAALQRQQIGLA